MKIDLHKFTADCAIELNRKRRHGFATLLVMLAIAALSLAVYAFANQTFLEHVATRASIRQSQARYAALGGVDQVRSRILSGNLEQHRLVNSNQQPVFALADPLQAEYPTAVYRQISRTSAVPGLASQSAKLNIHSLDLTRGGEVLSRARLVSLPHVTPQMADALLDWLDADNDPRAFGAESTWYTAHMPGALPANGPLRTLHQLTYIRDFDERLVFGEDTNHNGWLDWHEDDGDAQMPPDNRDGKLDGGLVQYLCLDAFESNLDSLGNCKINLNEADLANLYSHLEKRFGERVATYVVAYRLDGPVVRANTRQEEDLRKVLDHSFDARLEAQLDSAGAQADTRKATKQTFLRKGGIALERTPLYPIASVLDLVNTSVITLINGEEKMLNSPWTLNGEDAHHLLLELEDALTTSGASRLAGRIDINQAPLEVLLTIPGISRAVAESLIATRQQAQAGLANDSFRTVYWLVENQVMDVDYLRSIAGYIAVGGAIYSGYSAGHDLASQSSAIIKFTLSREGQSVRLLEQYEIGFAPLIEQEVRHERSRFP